SGWQDRAAAGSGVRAGVRSGLFEEGGKYKTVVDACPERSATLQGFCGHVGVHAVKCGVVCALLGGEAERFYSLDQDFFCFGLRLEEMHDFGDEVVERHGARV